MKISCYFIFFFATLYCFSNEFQNPVRVDCLTQNLNLEGTGLEVAPFHRPTLEKGYFNIFYTDYASTDELIRKHLHLETIDKIKANIVDVDFIWPPGESLQTVTKKIKFDYVIASHVIEHVPNVIGWLSELLSVLKDGGIISLAIPDKRYTFDAYRSNTEVSELIDLWLRNQCIPSPAQIYDMLSKSCDLTTFDQQPAENGVPFESFNRNYSDQQALEFSMWSYRTGEYLDIHCSVFTPESFKQIILKLIELNVMNVQVSEPICFPGEFFVQIKKLGDPKIKLR